MQISTSRLRFLLNSNEFIYLPGTCDPLGGKLIESMEFKAVYVGGWATGAVRSITEPMLTMNEQLQVASDVANAVNVPVVTDAGAGFGEPMHAMRTVREFIRGGIAGIHIEDQAYPKRAHYHKSVVQTIPPKEFIDKIRLCCKQRDKLDQDFLIIARSDTCRNEGLEEAIRRINMAADVGADMGFLFPRNHDEAVRAPKMSRLPLVYDISWGNRDGRPVYSPQQLREMGYKAGIDSLIYLCIAFNFVREALGEINKTGKYSAMKNEDFVHIRKEIEDLIGLKEYYKIEEETVERTQKP